jgi:hypothetical protein
MKKALFALLVAVLLGCSVMIFAQQPKDVYVKSVPIVKILSHRLGYKVYYLKQNMDLASFYAPVQWFVGTAGKGKIIWGRKPEYPYFTIVWENGEFLYIKLFLFENYDHDSWGTLKAADSQVREVFDVDAPKLEF